MATAMARDDPQIQAKAAQLRARYLERAAPHLVAEFGCPRGHMRTLRRQGLQRVAELRQSLGQTGCSRQGLLPPPPPPPSQQALLQSRVDRLYSEYAAASTQLHQLGASKGPGSLAEDLEEVEVPAGWSTLMYANAEGSVFEVSIDEVGALLDVGDITEDTYVIVEGMPNWATFKEFVAMYSLEDEVLLGSRRASPDTRAHFRDEMVSEALGSEALGGRPPLLSSASLQSLSHMEEMKERRKSLLREASQTTITMLSPSRTGSVEGSPRVSPLSALSPARALDPQTVRRPLHRPALSPIPGSGDPGATVASPEIRGAASKGI